MHTDKGVDNFAEMKDSIMSSDDSKSSDLPKSSVYEESSLEFMLSISHDKTDDNIKLHRKAISQDLNNLEDLTERLNTEVKEIHAYGVKGWKSRIKKLKH